MNKDKAGCVLVGLGLLLAAGLAAAIWFFNQLILID
jgi:hypothetical protein